MNFNWNKKWKSVLIWLSAYLNYIAFILVGGYFYINKDEAVEKETKQAFLVTLIFAGVSAFFAIFNYIGTLVDGYYSSDAYKFYSVCTSLVAIAKIIVFALFLVLALVKKEEREKTNE